MLILKTALLKLFNLISFFIIAKAILSWFPGAQDSRIYVLLDDLTEPIEAPIRRISSNFIRGPFDFTPMIALIVLMLLGNFVSKFL